MQALAEVDKDECPNNRVDSEIPSEDKYIK